MKRQLPPLKALLTFEALARHGDRGAAAGELNITPGALAKAVRMLEDWMGVTLVEGATLTKSGRTLAASLSGGLDSIDAGIAAIRPRSEQPELSVLAPATLALTWLMPQLPGLAADAGAGVIVHATHTGDDWQTLAHDVVIRRDSWVPPGYRSEALTRELLTLAVAPALVGDPAETPAALVGRVPHLRAATRLGDAERWLLEADAGTTLGHPSHSFGHLYVAYQAALRGHGWIVAPTIAIAEDVRHGRLVAPFPNLRVRGAAVALLSRADRASQARTAPLRASLHGVALAA
ncbi:LysR substrate-binding domain-containing protein [Roseomonas harenae]|uniref:LysR substrate-binding domain-containing protein n=1 Tax=Muricoccus harenae TaxID=2692566 RepID=UPI001331187A|nr:LysR substrate-binding domain-containing protein [Roseomonas harenae]